MSDKNKQQDSGKRIEKALPSKAYLKSNLNSQIKTKLALDAAIRAKIGSQEGADKKGTDQSSNPKSE